MSAITKTVAVMQKSPQAPIYPQAFTPETYSAALIDLKNILLERADDEDTLSFSLQNMGITLINMEITENFPQRAAKKIDELRYEILGDPFDFSEQPNLCIEPLFDGEWIWSKPRYDEYIRLSKFSPFTGELFVAKPHILAQKICLWIKKFLPDKAQVTQAERKELVVIGQFDALSIRDPMAQLRDQVVLNAWQANARAVKFKRDSQQQRKVIKEITKEAKEGIARTRELLKQEAELLRQERAEHEAKVKETLWAIDRDHQIAAASLHARLDVGDEKLKEAEGRLEKAEAEVVGLNQRNSQLNVQIYQQQQQLAAMQNNSDGGFCTIL